MLMDADRISHPEPTGGPANVSITPGLLIRLARGFSAVFWGIPVSLMLYAGALDIRVYSTFRIPAYVLGIVVIYAGLVFLRRAGAITPRWLRTVRVLLVMLVFEFYLAPFVYWWKQMPYVPYYVINVFALLACTTLGLFFMNQLAGEVGRIAHDTTFLIETQICAWLSLALMLLPVLHSLYYSVRAILELRSVIFFESTSLPPPLPPWTYAIILLPFTLTMATAWKAKERSLDLLRRSAGARAPARA